MRATTSYSIRRRLALGTALAGSLIMFAPGAFAQATAGQLPNDLNVNSNPQGATITGGTGSGTPTSLNVGLNAKQSVIEWTHFDVPTGNQATFTDSTGAAGKAAVLNRVTGFGMTAPTVSRINGAINSAPGVEVWLINPAGIMVGATGAINTGGFVASTLDIADADFIGGNYRLSGADTGEISMRGSIVTTGGALVMVAPKISVDGTLTATPAGGEGGDIALVAATDASFTLANGSPLSITITEGTTVASPMLVKGTVSGTSAYFAVATRSTVTDALLRVDAAVTASTAIATDRGIVFAAGADAPGVTIGGGPGDVGGNVRVVIGGTQTTTGAAASPDIVVRAAGEVRIGAALTSAGALDIGSATSDIFSTAMLTAATDLDLNAGGQIRIGNGAGGTVSATAAGGVIFGGLTADTDLTVEGSAITAGTATATAGALGLTATTGGIRLTAGTAGTAATLTANNGALGLGTVDSGTGDITVRGASLGAGAFESSGGSIDIETTGAATLTSASALAGSVRVAGSSVSVGTAGAATDLTLESTVGDVSLTDGTAGGLARVDAAGNARIAALETTGGSIDIDAGGGLAALGGAAPTLTASGDVLIDTVGAVRAGAIQAGNDVIVTGASLNIDSATATAGQLSLTAAPGNLTLDMGSAGTSVTLTANSGVLTLGTVDSATGDITVRGVRVASGELESSGGAIDVETTGTATLTSASSLAGSVLIQGASVSVVTADATTDLTLRSTVGDVSLTDGSAGGLARVDAAGNARIASLETTGGSIDIDAGAGLTGVGGALPTLTASGDVLIDAVGPVRIGSIVGGTELTLGTDVIVTGGSLNIDSATAAWGRLELTATTGNLTLGASDSNASTTLTANNGTLALGTVRTGSTGYPSGLTGPGDITVRGARLASGSFDTFDGSVDIETTGTATLNSAIAAGSLRITGTSIAVGTAAAATDLTLEATAGDLTLSYGVALDEARLSTPGNARIGATDIMIRSLDIDVGGNLTGIGSGAASLAAGELFVNVGGSIRASVIDSATIAVVEAAAIDVGFASADRLQLTALTGDLTVDTFYYGLSGDLTANNGALTLGVVGGFGNATIRGARLVSGMFDTVSGAIDIETTGAAALTSAVSIDGTVRVVGSSVSAGTISTGSNVTLQSSVGDVSLTNGMIGGLARIDAVGNVRLGFVGAGMGVDLDAGGSLLGIGATLPTVTAGGDVLIDTGGSVRAETIFATNDVIVTGSALNIDSAMADGTLGLTATTGNLTLGMSESGGSTALTANNGTLALGAILGFGDLTVRGARLSSGTFDTGSGAIDIETSGAAALNYAASGGGAVRVVGASVSADLVQAGAELTVEATAGNVTLTTGIAGGLARVGATGNVRLTSLESTGGGIDIDAGGALAGIGTVRPTLMAGGDVLIDVGGAATLGNVSTGNFANDVIVNAGGAVRATDIYASNDIVVNGTAIELGMANAFAGRLLLTATAGNVTLGIGSAQQLARIEATGNVRVTELNGGGIQVVAGGLASAALLSSGNDLSVSAARIDIQSAFGNSTLSLDAVDTLKVGFAQAGGDASLTAGGAIALPGDVFSGGDIRIRGSAITLGFGIGGSSLQARGGIDITSTNGAIRAGAIGVIANTDNVGSEAVILDATGGGILFDANSLIGQNMAAPIGIRLGTPGTSLALGWVDALSLQGADAAHNLLPTLITQGPITLAGPTNLRNALSIVSTGGAVSLGDVTINDLGQGISVSTLGGGGAISGGPLRAWGDINLTSADRITVSEIRSNAGSVALIGGRLVLGDVNAGDALTLIATNGDLVLDGGFARNDLRLDASGAIRFVSLLSDLGSVDVVAGTTVSGSFVGAGVDVDIVGGSTVTLGNVEAGGAVGILAGTGLSVTELEAGGSIALDSTTGAITLDTAMVGGDATLNAGTAITIGSLVSTGGAIRATAGTGLTATSLEAGGLVDLDSGTRGIAVTSTIAGTTLDVDTTGAIALDMATAGGDATLNAGTAITIGSLASTGGAIRATAGTGLTATSLDAGGLIDLESGTRGIVVTSTIAGTTLDMGTTGAIRLDTATAGGAATLDAGTTIAIGSLVTTDGTIDAQAVGGLTATTLRAGGATADLIVDGGTVATIGTAEAGRAIDVTAGRISVGQAIAGTTLDLGTAGAIVLDTATAGGDATLNAGTAITIGSLVSTGGAIRATAGTGLTATSLEAGGLIDLDSGTRGIAVTSTIAGTTLDVGTTGAIRLDMATAGGDATLDAGAAITIGSLASTGGAIRATAGTGLTATSLEAGGLIDLESGTRGIAVTSTIAGTTLDVGTTGAIRLDTATAGGAATLDAGTTIAIGSLITTNGTVDADAVGGLTATTLRAGGATSDLIVDGGTVATIGTAAAGRSIDVTAGRIVVGQASAGGTIELTATGDLSLGQSSSGGATRLVAGGAISLPGDVTVGTISPASDLVVRGARVSLGVDDGAETIAATGAIDITATNGAITGGANLTLRSNSDGLGAEALILDATGGGIDFAASSLIAGGTARQSDIGIRLGTAGRTLRLGTVQARGLLGAPVDHTQPLLGTLQTGGDIVVTGPVTLTNALSLSTSGGIDLAAVDILGGGQGATLVASGLIAVDSLVAPGAVSIDAGLAASAGTVRSSASSVTVSGRSVTIDTAGAATALAITSDSGALSLRTGTAGTTAMLDANGGGVNLDSLVTTNGSVTIATDGGLDAFADAGRTATITAGGAGSDLTITGAGTARLGAARAADALTITMGAIDATTATATGGAASLTATSGGVRAGTVQSGTTLAVRSAGTAGIDIDTAQAGTDASFVAGGQGSITLDMATAGGSALVDAGIGATIGSLVTTNGTIDVRTTRDLTATTLAAGGATSDLLVDSGRSVAIGAARAGRSIDIDAGLAVSVDQATATAGSIAVSGATVDIGDATAGTTIGLVATGDLNLTAATAGGAVTLSVGDTATLGTISTPASTLTITASDAEIGGDLTARDIIVRTTSRNFVLGDQPAGNPLTGGTAFRLTNTEFGRLKASQSLTVDTSVGGIEFGDLRIGLDNGTQSVSFRALGTLTVKGLVDASDAVASPTSRFFFGGTGGGASKAQAIRIIALGADANRPGSNGGSLQLGAAGVTLSAGSVVAGQAGGFLRDVDTLGGDPLRLNAFLISNAGSSLYNATNPDFNTAAPAGTAYAPGFTLLSAGEVTVSYDSYALFQNTALAGSNSGVTIGSRLNLNGIGTSQFAMYGSIAGAGDIQTSLLGVGNLAVSDTDPLATRINGCLIGGAGCIVTDISQPILNVFDTSRVDILKTPDKLQLPFDPLVGTNNEALFTGVGAIDIPVEEGECAERDKDGKCVPSGGDR